MKVEIWSDIVCPFCYIGKRHFEKALEQLPFNNDVEVIWKSFQLDPYVPEKPDEKSLFQYLANSKGISLRQSKEMHENVTKMAASAGLDFHFENAIVANSLKAHRVLQLAKSKDLGDALKERFLKAYFIEGKDMGSSKEIKSLASEAGIAGDEVEKALMDDAYSYLVKQDIQESQQIGVTGVPFFVFNGKYAVSGAQPIEHFKQVLEKSYAEWKESEQQTLVHEVGDGPSCAPGEDC